MIRLFQHFEATYIRAAEKSGLDPEEAKRRIETLKGFSLEEVRSPTQFGAFHESERAPFDFYRFGLDFFRPLIDFEHSTLKGEAIWDEIESALKRGGNAVLLANHQTEPDPQIISLMLEARYPELAEKMIYVAGSRVTSDPVAIPFSRGRNLICIYSKRHIENPPELKEEKTLHNRKAIEGLKRLLQEGGKCIFVAPSGGRDRPNENGKLLPALFDPQSLELFRIVAKGTSTSFYPMSLKTYAIMPPPDMVEKKLGEKRSAGFAPVEVSLGKAVDLDDFPGKPLEKESIKEKRAEYVYNAVLEQYLC